MNAGAPALGRLAGRALAALGLTASPAAPLPPRVARMVAAQQASAEVLIGIMQVAAIVTFAVLYALSRRANPMPMSIEPVPIALALYAGFTGLRLWLALRNRLTGTLLALSVLVDMAVLMVTIWSFHLQYQAPAAIYLKAPTLMYVFILIVLRALRFEARWVLLAGAAAILGWTSLVAYALFADDATVRITRSFAEYMTSTSILLGAEFDKAVSIGMVTLILALVVLRAQRLLVAAAREHVAAAELSRFFVPEIARRIRESHMDIATGTAEHRDAAILMTDLRGFTRLAQELPPAALLRLLSDYQTLVVETVRAHGGSIDKFLGDGVLASFGAVTPNQHYAADALRAIDALHVTLAEWSRAAAEAGLPPLAVGMAVATGEVLFGAVGHTTRLEYTVIGDAVNLAAKLEKHNKAEASMAVAPAAALDLALAQGYAPARAIERRPARHVAGVGAPMDLAILQGA